MFKIAAAIFTLIAVVTEAAQARVFTDSGGRVIEVPFKVSRVFAAGPPAAVLLYALAPERMTGWSRQPTPEEKQYLLPTIRELPPLGRITDRKEAPELEALLAAKPDLILDVGTVNEAYIALADQIQKRTGIPYVLLDGSLLRSAETLRQAGEVLGLPERADELAAYAEETLSTVSELAPTNSTYAQPRVYFARDHNGLETGIPGSIHLEALEALGARNIPAAASTGGSTFVTTEQVLKWKPDIIFALKRDFQQKVMSEPA